MPSNNPNAKRGPNFTVKEIEKLVQLVKFYWNIINSKETDATTNASKIDAWKSIERRFNQDEASSIYRPHYVLRTKFDNLKRLRKKNSAQNVSKSNDSSGPANDADEDCFDSFQSAVAAKVKRSGYENCDLSIFDSPSETVDCEPRVAVTAFFKESDPKFFINEIDGNEDSADGENEEFEWRGASIRETVSEAQDSCITQSTEESLSRKRKLDKSLSEGNATEFNDLRKKAFLEKHNLTLKLLKEEAEQRMQHESTLQKLREEELRLRIQFMKDKHETELNSMKANATLDMKI